MAKILVVEDDEVLGLAVLAALESRKHSVEVVSNGRDALKLLRSFGYEILILDWVVPGMTGIELLREYRHQKGNAGVLMLTAKDHIQDKEQGFETGADDYLTKPFEVRELLVRIDGLLRRGRDFQDEILRIQAVEINTKTKVAKVDSEEIALSATEFSVLEFLMKRRGRYFTVNDLLYEIWASDSEVSEHAVRQCISRLRSKLSKPDRESIIKTYKGLGYRVE